jgi:parvulin-like peptidyl-prolyl isomerase
VTNPTGDDLPAGNAKGADDIVPATASSNGQDLVATADFQEVKDPVTGLSRIPGDTLTNFPGSIDVIGDGVTVKQGVVACTVNGQPIFVEDALRDFPPEIIAQQEKTLDPKQFHEWYKHLVDAHLQRPIEEELLLQALQVKLKPEQIKEINKQIDSMFNKEDLPAAMKAQGFQTEVEFERALKAKGQSIDLLRTKNRNRQLAQQYIQTKVMPKSGFDRPDLIKYYNEHKEDFEIPAQAKWDHIQLDYSKNGGPEATRKKADEIEKRLAAGEDFAALAKECSNGPNASKGGARGWMRRGTLADEAIDKALFERPLNQVGDPIEDKQGIDIIRVVDRTAAGYKPFSAVQEDIRAQLKNIEWTKASKKLFDELFEKANIVKMTDNL